jgi:hypothetical protein
MYHPSVSITRALIISPGMRDDAGKRRKRREGDGRELAPCVISVSGARARAPPPPPLGMNKIRVERTRERGDERSLRGSVDFFA